MAKARGEGHIVTMRKAGLIIAVAGAAVLFGTTSAFAQSAQGRAPAAPAAPKAKAPFAADTQGQARDAYALDQSQSRQVIELDASKRWSLNLKIQPPVTRQLELKDVEAGANFKLNPSLRLGGSVGLADKSAPDEAAQRLQENRQKPERVFPRVKLNAIFKF